MTKPPTVTAPLTLLYYHSACSPEPKEHTPPLPLPKKKLLSLHWSGCPTWRKALPATYTFFSFLLFPISPVFVFLSKPSPTLLFLHQPAWLLNHLHGRPSHPLPCAWDPCMERGPPTHLGCCQLLQVVK